MRYRDLIESDDPPTYPPKIQKLLGKPIKIALKDGREGILTITPSQRKGLDVSCTVDGEYAGNLDVDQNGVPDAPDDPEEWDQYEDDRGSWSASGVFINQQFRRQGIAKAMYDLLARAGLKIMRSGSYGGSLKPDGASLWQSQVQYKKKRGSSLATPTYQRFWKPKAKA